MRLVKIKLFIDRDVVDINDSSALTNITVKCTDYNDNPIKDETLNISSKLGNLVYNSTSSKSITATTDSNGEIVLNYTPLTWGLETISCDTKKLQFQIKGWKSVTVASSSTINIYLHHNETYCKFVGRVENFTVTNGWKQLGTINDTSLRPWQGAFSRGYGVQTLWQVGGDGKIWIRRYDSTASFTGSDYITLMWGKREAI